MILPTDAFGPAPCAPPTLPASPPSGLVEVDAPSAPLVPPAPGTWLPATGGSTVVAFLGQPARSAAATNKQAIDTIFFIDIPSECWLKPKCETPCIMNRVERYIDLRKATRRVPAPRPRSRPSAPAHASRGSRAQAHRVRGRGSHR